MSMYMDGTQEITSRCCLRQQRLSSGVSVDDELLDSWFGVPDWKPPGWQLLWRGSPYVHHKVHCAQCVDQGECVLCSVMVVG